MRPLSTLCLAGLAFLLTAPAAQAQMRCKNDLAQVGDAKSSVLQKCGEPVMKDSFCKPGDPQQMSPATPGASVTVNVLPCEHVEEWTYNPGRGQFMTILRFEAGALR